MEKWWWWFLNSALNVFTVSNPLTLYYYITSSSCRNFVCVFVWFITLDTLNLKHERKEQSLSTDEKLFFNPIDFLVRDARFSHFTSNVVYIGERVFTVSMHLFSHKQWFCSKKKYDFCGLLDLPNLPCHSVRMHAFLLHSLYCSMCSSRGNLLQNNFFSWLFLYKELLWDSSG